MQHQFIINELERHAQVFQETLRNILPEMHTWKPAPEKWNLLEIVCHLYDEEREDFRARVKHILLQPDQPMPSIDPVDWVSSRQYALQNYEAKISDFVAERQASVAWLRSLSKAAWQNIYQHPTLGPMSAEMILTNWLAHDYLHIRQITGTKYQYLKHHSTANLNYAGNW